ncbi:hypothetical protein P8452_47506 [Trifolium repens]|nr:hypothetical protein P8452_47506 [Trifolium repens]
MPSFEDQNLTFDSLTDFQSKVAGLNEYDFILAWCDRQSQDRPNLHVIGITPGSSGGLEGVLISSIYIVVFHSFIEGQIVRYIALGYAAEKMHPDPKQHQSPLKEGFSKVQQIELKKLNLVRNQHVLEPTHL